jgi:hypothetical protein
VSAVAAGELRSHDQLVAEVLQQIRTDRPDLAELTVWLDLVSEWGTDDQCNQLARMIAPDDGAFLMRVLVKVMGTHGLCLGDEGAA